MLFGDHVSGARLDLVFVNNLDVSDLGTADLVNNNMITVCNISCVTESGHAA